MFFTAKLCRDHDKTILSNFFYKLQSYLQHNKVLDATMKDFTSLNNKELEDFFNSFDTVFSDCDGVLSNIMEKIPGTPDAVRSLKKIGKQMIIVTNNSSKSLDFFHQELKSAGLDFEKDEIVTPILTMVSYLKKQNLTKDVLVLGMTPLKNALRDAGFNIAENGPDRIKETVRAFVETTLPDDGTVGAVISDFDVNVKYVDLQKAVTFLLRPEVHFLVGATDAKGPVSLTQWIMGPWFFHNMLEVTTGRRGVRMAKPSPYLHEYVMEKYKIKDASRILFIGDSIPEDMGFATQFGYKKLLVLSGLSKRNNLENWTYPEEYKPDYYVESLKNVHDLILHVFGNTL